MKNSYVLLVNVINIELYLHSILYNTIRYFITIKRPLEGQRLSNQSTNKSQSYNVAQESSS